MGKAFDELASSLKQAIAYKQGDKSVAKVVTIPQTVKEKSKIYEQKPKRDRKLKQFP